MAPVSGDVEVLEMTTKKMAEMQPEGAELAAIWRRGMPDVSHLPTRRMYPESSVIANEAVNFELILLLFAHVPTSTFLQYDDLTVLIFNAKTMGHRK